VFGLPTTTAALVFGFPLFWVVYTAGFWLLTRHWVQHDGRER